MKYELVKELKDAGFNFRYIEEDESRPFPNEDITWMWHTPTLSELIEACGDRFVSLERDHIDPTEEASFIATGKFGDYVEMHGFTKDPTSAVARLWLALNKK